MRFLNPLRHLLTMHFEWSPSAVGSKRRQSDYIRNKRSFKEFVVLMARQGQHACQFLNSGPLRMEFHQSLKQDRVISAGRRVKQGMLLGAALGRKESSHDYREEASPQ